LGLASPFDDFRHPTHHIINAAKGDKNAAHWLPANSMHDFRKRFVTLQVQVKARYKLSVTESEAAAMRQVLGG